MIPTMQRTDNDCVKCCICTILGFDYEDIPCVGHLTGDERWDILSAFLAQHGYAMFSVDYDVLDGYVVNFPHIVITHSQLDEINGKFPNNRHAVVFKGDTLKFDPGGISEHDRLVPSMRWLIMKPPVDI
jgi:hypothetical protein